MNHVEPSRIFRIPEFHQRDSIARASDDIVESGRNTRRSAVPRKHRRANPLVLRECPRARAVGSLKDLRMKIDFLTALLAGLLFGAGLLLSRILPRALPPDTRIGSLQQFLHLG